MLLTFGSHGSAAHVACALFFLLLLLLASPCASSSGKPAERWLDVRLGSTFRIRALERLPNSEPSALVLILHGARFTADIWERTDTLRAVASVGARALALDLPGYGQSPPGPRGSLEGLVPAILDAEGASNTFVLSASMSGHAANAALALSPQRVLGYIAVSPAGLHKYASDIQQDSGAQVPTLLLWGNRDSPEGPTAQLHERTFRNSRKVVLQGA